VLKSAKRAESEGGASKDDVQRVQKKIQEIVDKYNAEIKAIVEAKEVEVMTV
jgi:ribosome recycling factor